MSDILTGRTIADYELRRVIAKGGMGTVYEAAKIPDGFKVALKIPNPDLAASEVYLQRFLLEARLASKVRHPNIVQTYDAGSDGAIHYIAMEYVWGRPLQHAIKEKELSLVQALRIALQAALALDEIHRHAIVHRDIKPKNILLEFNGRPKVMDFGLARVLEVGVAQARLRDQEGLRRKSDWMGTPVYVAPEQLLKFRADPRADIYALGIVLFEMITGRVPFYSRNKPELRRMILAVPPPSLARLNPLLPPFLDRILQRALAKNPDERHASALEFAEEIKRGLEELEPPEAPEDPPERKSVPAGFIHRIGGYEPIRLVGRGKLGVVYEAQEIGRGRRIALKVLHDHLSREPGYAARFHRELLQAVPVRHPNLIEVYESGVEGSAHFAASEWIEGDTLSQRIQQSPVMNVPQSLEIVRLIALGLATLHRNGLLHRNISPDNILLKDGIVPKLADCGIAMPRRRDNSWDTPSPGLREALQYSPPEQCFVMRRDERSDIYSLGVVLFEMLAGRPPFRAKGDWELLQMILDAPVPSLAQFNPKVAPRVQGIVEKAMAKKPELRYLNADEFALDLEAVLREIQEK